MRATRLLLPVVSVLFLAGCAVTAPELDRSELASDISVQGIALPESEMPRPSGELMLDGAIHQALWRNPRMQSAYAKLDLTAADVVEASQFSNPSLSLSAMRPEGGGGNDYDLGLAWGISGLLMRSSRRDIARSHWESTRLQLAEGIVALASDTERAWYEAVAARQRVQVQALETRAAELGGVWESAFMMLAISTIWSGWSCISRSPSIGWICKRRARVSARRGCVWPT